MNETPSRETNNKEKIKRRERENDRLLNLWQDNKEKYVYNPLTNKASFARRKPTDYKMNKFVHLPRPLHGDEEFLCETRRRKYLKAYERYLEILKEKEEKRYVKALKKKTPPEGTESLKLKSD